MKKIYLVNGGYALVDDEDYDYLSTWKWRRNPSGYAYRYEYSEGKKVYIFMHREILSTPKGKDTDHIDENKRNNQRCNLRVATRSQNNANRRKGLSTAKIKYKGVSPSKYTPKYRSTIAKDGKQYHLGYHVTIEEAALAYNKKALELYGEFASLNNIGESSEIKNKQ